MFRRCQLISECCFVRCWKQLINDCRNGMENSRENLQSRPTWGEGWKGGGGIQSGGKGQQDERTSPYIKRRGTWPFIVRFYRTRPKCQLLSETARSGLVCQQTVGLKTREAGGSQARRADYGWIHNLRTYIHCNFRSATISDTLTFEFWHGK